MNKEENALLNDREMLQGKIKLVSRPRIASIGLTLRCNMNCIMCFTQKMKKIDMKGEIFANTKALFPTLEEARWNDAGELFASKNCDEYLQTINELKVPKSYLSSNFKAAGTYMEQILAGGLTHLSVSIDAATAETYESIRRGGKFSELMDNLDRFATLKRERGLTHPYLTLVFIAMKRNVQELPLFVDLAAKFDAVEIHVLRLLPNPGGVDKDETISLETLRPFYKEAHDKATTAGIRLSHIAYTDEELLGPVETVKSGPVPDGYRSPVIKRSHFEFEGYPFCRSPWTEVLIDVEGKVRPCCYHPKVLGDLSRDSILDIWNNEDYQEFRRKIREHDFTECHFCPWLHKVFHYQIPEAPGTFHPLNRRLQALEKGWDLKNDLVNRTAPFTDLKVELDPMAFRMNKEWDLGSVLPDVQETIGSSGSVKESVKDITSMKNTWEKIRQEDQEKVQQSSRANPKDMLKDMILKTLRFHTGARFEEQSSSNIWFTDRLEELFTQNAGVIDYIDVMRQFMENQKNFNALLVQYLNQFSDRMFERVERQKDLNFEILHTLRQTNERIDALHRDNNVLLDIVSRSTSQKSADKQAASLNSVRDTYFKGELVVDSMPSTVHPETVVNITVSVRNKSSFEWSVSSGPDRVGIDCLWIFEGAKQAESLPHEPVWLDKSLAPDMIVSIPFSTITPAQRGKYRLFISLLSGDNVWFGPLEGNFVELAVEVKSDTA